MAHTLAFISYFTVATAFFVLDVHAATEVGGSCLPGSKHKPKPSPEGPEYKACLIFKESSCCTAKFTNQLAVPVIQKIGSFSWNLCGNLSKKCQDFMVEVECFYSCSPYVAHWQDKNEEQAFNNAPVCSHYCNNWYDACQDDMTCAKNWLKDFNISSDWSNSCKSDCKPFKEIFRDGKDLCENLWDDSFKYTEPDDGLCLHFNFSGPTNPNKEVVEKLFGEVGDSVVVKSSIFAVIFTLLISYAL